MRLAHTALWTRDLDAAVAFWSKYFDATAGEPYHSKRRAGFISRFLTLRGEGAQIELMTGPWVKRADADERTGWDHIAISVGDAGKVDALAAQCAQDGCLVSGPRMTGDGFYEAVIAMPDGTRIEITS